MQRIAIVVLSMALIGYAVAQSESSSDIDLELYGFGNGNGNTQRCNVMGRNFSCVTGFPCSLCYPHKLATNVTQICSGRAHTLALTSSGRVLGVGSRALLGIGVGAAADACEPTQQFVDLVALNAIFAASGGIARISCNFNFSAVTGKNGASYVFGFNTAGALAVHREAELPHIASPAFLNATSLLGVDQNFTSIAFGVNAMIFALQNGSVGTAGTGILRGFDAAEVAASDTSPRLFAQTAIPLSCAVTKIHVHSQHVIVRCADGRAFGWGDNSHRQLLSTVIDAVPTPTQIVLPSEVSDATKAEFSVGHSHTVLIDTDSKRVFARGDNAAGQLGLPSATTTASVWTETAVGRGIVRASAGNGYTMFVSDSRVSVLSGTTNVFASGSNGGCALGLSSTTGNVFSLAPVSFTPHGNKRVVSALAGENRRTYILVEQTRTLTSSVTTTETRSLVQTVSNTFPTATLSQSSSPSQSSTVTLTTTRPITPSETVPPTKSRTDSTTANRTASYSISVSTSSSFTTPGAPVISDVVLVAASHAINIFFDRPTDKNNGSDVVPYGALVDILFVVRGARQTLGNNYDGEWVSASHFVLRYDALFGNVTAGVGEIAVSPRSKIRNEARTSQPAVSFYFVTAREGSTRFAGRETIGVEPWLKTVAIVFGVVFAVLTIVVMLLFFLRHKRSKAIAKSDPFQQEEERKIERYYVHVGTEESGLRTVTKSSVRHGAQFDHGRTNYHAGGREMEPIYDAAATPDHNSGLPVAGDGDSEDQRSRGAPLALKSGSFVQLERATRSAFSPTVRGSNPFVTSAYDPRARNLPSLYDVRQEWRRVEANDVNPRQNFVIESSHVQPGLAAASPTQEFATVVSAARSRTPAGHAGAVLSAATAARLTAAAAFSDDRYGSASPVPPTAVRTPMDLLREMNEGTS